MRLVAIDTRTVLWLALDRDVWSAMSQETWANHGVFCPQLGVLEGALHNSMWNVFQDEVVP